MKDKTQTRHYDYVPIIDHEPLCLPDNKRIAILPFVNLEHFPAHMPGTALVPATTGFTPDPLNYGWRDYGNRVGVWRIMEMMDAHNVRATACLNSDVDREYPRIIEEGQKRDWAWIGHGINNTPNNLIATPSENDGLLDGPDEAKERIILASVLNEMEATFGQPTKGWLSPYLTHTDNTPRLLAELGVEYLCDYTADDQPFRFKAPADNLIAIPYTLELNDFPVFLTAGLSSKVFGDMIIDQFDVLYGEGATNPRCMPICLHTFLSGQPNKSKHIRRALEHISSHEDVWMTTGDELNAWYRQNYL